MNRWRLAVSAVAFVVALTSSAPTLSAADLPTVDQLLARMEEAVSKIQTYEGDMVTTIASNNSGRMTFHLAREIVMKDGRDIGRASMCFTETHKAPDGKVKTILQTTNTNDGTFSWSETRDFRNNQVRVSKGNAQPMTPPWGLTEDLRFLKNACQRYGITAVTEATIDGRKMYVLVGALKTDTESSAYWVDQESLLLRRKARTTVSQAKGDRPRPLTVTDDYLNLKLNQLIDPKLFEYTPPEGAVVTDKTQPKP